MYRKGHKRRKQAKKSTKKGKGRERKEEKNVDSGTHPWQTQKSGIMV